MNGEDYPDLLSETTLSTLLITSRNAPSQGIDCPSEAFLLPKILQTLSKNGAEVNFYNRPTIFYAIILYSLG
jgi:hypothetical protein